MTAMPRPPSRTLTYSAAASGAIAGVLGIASLVTFAVRQGERMAPDEIRLCLTALAVGAVAMALCAHWRRKRARYQQFEDYGPFKARLDEFEEQLRHLDEGLAAIAARTQRLANCLEVVQVEPGPGEDTADLIRLPRPRPSHLRRVKNDRVPPPAPHPQDH